MAITRILTGTEPLAAKNRFKGYIVIKDTAQSRMHGNSCEHVTPESFQVKSIDNAGRNGEYYTVDTHREAQSLGAVPCKVCAP